MKFFLIRGASIVAPPQTAQDIGLRVRRLMAKITSSDIVPTEGSSSGVTGLCNKLRQRLQALSASAQVEWLHFEMANAVYHDINLRIQSSPVTRALVDLFGNGVKIQMEFNNMFTSSSSGGGAFGNIHSTEMTIRNYGNYACEDEGFYKRQKDGVQTKLRYLTAIALDLRGELTVTVSVDQSGFVETVSGPVVTDKMQVNRKMLQEELGSDLVIISKNGKQVKAHMGMLSAHSDVFKAMFQSDMVEAKTRTVEMQDLSEEGVRGLLAYLYCWEEEEPNSKPLVAFEMLQAGHMYDIPVLETSMKKLLLGKPDQWYNMDVALKLFLFARNLPEDGDRLKMKAIQVMKMNFRNFKKSPTYAALFKEDPDAAMELCEYFVA